MGGETNLLDHRILLKAELDERRRKNSSYSLRSFAKCLGVSAPYISQLLSHKRGLSEEAGIQFSKKLKWTPEKRSLFINLVRYEKTRDEEAKRLLLKEMSTSIADLKFLELQKEEFDLVAHWFHFAIVELTTLSDFKSQPKWIAQRLGISLTEAEMAIRRLMKLGLLKLQDGKLVKSISNYRIKDVPSQAIRQFHRDHLLAAMTALESQTPDERDISGTTVAFNRKHLAEVQELIRDFRNRLNSYCSKDKSPDAVYQLSVQFFRLDKETN